MVVVMHDLEDTRRDQAALGIAEGSSKAPVAARGRCCAGWHRTRGMDG
jgi:hypothetical protein